MVGWCKEEGIQVWPDLHTAPGSQNGFDNSGHLGKKTESLVVDGMGNTKLEWLEATPPNHYLTMLKGL